MAPKIRLDRDRGLCKPRYGVVSAIKKPQNSVFGQVKKMQGGVWARPASPKALIMRGKRRQNVQIPG
jgi:hypothetical protein